MSTDIGVYITTHITEPEDSHHRHGPEMMTNQLERFEKNVIGGYAKYSAGIGILHDIYICDTGCTATGFLDRLNEWMGTDGISYLEHIKIPNNGGCFSALKYVMHIQPHLMDQYEYFLFQTDDGPRIKGNDWGSEIIKQYKNNPNLGIMGRLSETIRLGPAGLVDHRNVCPHIAKMYDILWVKEVSHLHADYYFMNQKTLKALAECWNDPVFSQEAMDYQLKYEQMDFQKVWELDKSRRTLDNIHIGREVDVSLRIKHFLNLDTATFESSLIKV